MLSNHEGILGSGLCDLTLSHLMDETICLFVQFEGMTQEICVSPLSTVQSLEQLLPFGSRYSFYMADIEMSPAFSFKFLGVTNYNVIRVIAHAPDPVPFEIPAKPADRQEKRRLVKDSLTDQFYNRVEGTVTTYRKLVHRFLSFNTSRGHRAERVRQTVIPEVQPTPATDELPHPYW
jgi:hypothetical protein